MVQPQSAKLSSAPQKLTCESPESEKDVDVDVDVSCTCTWTWFLEHAHLDWQMHVDDGHKTEGGLDLFSFNQTNVSY